MAGSKTPRQAPSSKHHKGFLHRDSQRAHTVHNNENRGGFIRLSKLLEQLNLDSDNTILDEPDPAAMKKRPDVDGNIRARVFSGPEFWGRGKVNEIAWAHEGNVHA